MGGRGGSSGGRSKMSADATYFKGVASELDTRAARDKERALNTIRRAHEFTKEALSGTRASPGSLLREFHSNDRAAQRYFAAKQREARADAIRETINKNPKATREQISNAEVKAAKDFAKSKVEVPSEMTGKSTTKAPRVVDMRSYFNKDGNPYNFTARGGVYQQMSESWGKSFADSERRRRS